MSARGVAMSTNNHAALRSIKARVSPMIRGTATGSRVALSRWARPSKAARHAAPPTTVTSEVKPILSWNSSSRKPKPSVEAVADATSPSADAEPDHLAHAKPIDFDMASKIEGQESQMVSFELEPGQVIRAEAGNLVFMEDGIEMDTSTGGGASSMFRRVITGQNMFVTDYVNKGDWNSKVGLGTDVPSKIIRLSLAAYGGEIICQRGAFLAGSHTIDIQTEFTKMMAGFFGGEGFVLQRLTGEGDAFVKASGPLIQRELMEGESLRVSSGSVVAFAPTVEYDVQTIPGFKNVVFGGEGLFITNLTGPGMVFLQGLPFDRMVDQIARRIPGNRGAGGLPFGLGGMGGGGGGGGEGGGEGVAATAAATGEDSAMHASGDGGASAESASGFGDAAVRSASSASSGNFEEYDHGFSKPPPEGSAGETTWGEGEATDGASDGGGGGVGEEGGGDLGEGEWEEGDEGDGSSGVRGVLSRMFAPREDADDDWDDWDTGDWD